MFTRQRRLPATRRAALAAFVVALVSITLAGLAVPMFAQAASSPTGAVAAAWPAGWNVYRMATGTQISDDNSDQNPGVLDLASGNCAGATCTVGEQSTVQYASDGTTAFFRIRMASDLADLTKGGIVNGAFLTQIAVNGVVEAVVGVDGKSASVDYVYVANDVGDTITTIYQFPFDSNGGQSSAGMRIIPAGDGSGNYFLDYQVPLSAITAISGNLITASTPIKLFYGSSAAANLATINKDFMTGSAVDFTNLATITLSPAAVALSSTATIQSGPNPPAVDVTSTYSVTVTASNPGGGDLSSPSISVPFPAGVTIVSATTATGSVTQSGATRTWSPGTLLPGASATATFIVSITPVATDEGTTPTLVSQQSASGTDAPLSETRTATAPAIVVGPVVAVAATQHTVAFDEAGGSAVPDQLVNDGELATDPGASTLADYTFDGWFTAASGGVAWDFSGAVSADTTIYAQFTLAAVQHSVTFDSAGGSSSPTQLVADGAAVTEPSLPTRAADTFNGWYTSAVGGSLWNFSDPISADLALYAQWTLGAPQYTVLFDSAGGSLVAGQTITSGSLASDPGTPTLTGYTFDGWFTAASGGAQWDFATDSIGEDTTLFAQWTAIPPTQYAVTFNSSGGSAISSQSVASGSPATDPGAPTLSGYTFDGWYTTAAGATAWDFTTPITEATEIFAQWMAIPPGSFAVTFDSGGGTSVPGQSIVSGSPAADPGAPTRSGYTFDGWYTAASGGSVWDFTTPITGATDIFAQWTAVPPQLHTMVFNTQGGSGVSDQAVADGDLATQPLNPSRSGFVFAGWYTAPTGGALWDFGVSPATDTTLFARWSAVSAAALAATGFENQGLLLVAVALLGLGLGLGVMAMARRRIVK